VTAIRAAHPEVRVMEVSDNQGYAGNNNWGIRAALALGAAWVLVLNEDTVLAPECLEALMRAGEADGRIGMVGPLLYHHSDPRRIQSAGGVLTKRWKLSHAGFNALDAGQYSTEREVDWLSGCAVMVRRQVMDEIGLLDERFFIYWEEVDWCLRARGRGWRLVHTPQAKLWHKGVTPEYAPKPAVTYYSTRNRFLILAKHRAPVLAWWVAIGETARNLASWTLRPKWRHMREHRQALWQGTRDFVMRRWGRWAPPASQGAARG
jgi:GT2 family glycosyltransferase